MPKQSHEHAQTPPSVEKNKQNKTKHTNKQTNNNPKANINNNNNNSNKTTTALLQEIASGQERLILLQSKVQGFWSAPELKLILSVHLGVR